MCVGVRDVYSFMGYHWRGQELQCIAGSQERSAASVLANGEPNHVLFRRQNSGGVGCKSRSANAQADRAYGHCELLSRSREQAFLVCERIRRLHGDFVGCPQQGICRHELSRLPSVCSVVESRRQLSLHSRRRQYHSVGRCARLDMMYR